MLGQQKKISAETIKEFCQEDPSLNTIASTNSTFSKPSVPTKECRICLEDQSTPNNQLIQPCKCLGSVRYVHQSCMKTWIEKLLMEKSEQEQQKLQAEGIQCELCKFLVKFQTYVEIKCRDSEGVTEQFTIKFWPLLLVVFVFALSIAGLGLTSWLISSNPIDSTNFLSVLSIVGLFLCCIFLLLAIYAFVSELFLQRIIKVEKVLKNTNNTLFKKHLKSKMQIFPVELQVNNNPVSVSGFVPQGVESSQQRR